MAMAIPVIGAIGWKAALGIAGIVGALGFGAGALAGAEKGGDKITVEPGATLNYTNPDVPTTPNGNIPLLGDLGNIMQMILPFLMLKMLF